MRVKVLLLVLLVCPAMGQVISEKVMQAKINDVTVFMNGAQIFRTGTVNLLKGESLIVVKKLSRYIDSKSIQVKGDGDFTILSINYSIGVSEGRNGSKSIDSLKKLIGIVDENISQNGALIKVLKAKQGMLDSNTEFNKEAGQITIAQLKQTVDFFETEYRKIKLSELGLLKENSNLEVKKRELNDRIKEIEDGAKETSGEIAIKVKSENGGKVILSINYLVAGASWHPKYDVRVKSIDEPVSLTYKAEVSQNTGEDWTKVKLTFSNASPNESGVLPKLNTWHLNYPRFTKKSRGVRQYGELSENAITGEVISSEDELGIPGVNVVIKGTTIGTITDINGRFTLTIPPGEGLELVFSFVGMKTVEVPIKGSELKVEMVPEIMHLSEVVVSALGSSTKGVFVRGNSSLGYSSNNSVSLRQGTLSVEMVENQTTFEFEIDEPYSISSGDDKIMIEMKTISMPAYYEYFAVPKLDRDAFLVARIIDWDQYKLLEGETNLFFEDAFVGRTILNATSLEDTLDISLGRDKSIVVARTLEDQYSKSRSLGVNKVESRGYKIMIRNKKSSDININVIDQIPVSANSDITVAVTEISNGRLNADSGIVEWKLNIKSQRQTEFLLHYEAKCPKGEKLVL